MNFSTSAIFDLIKLSVQRPQAAARYILSLDLPDAAGWLLALFVATASVVLTYIGIALLPPPASAFMGIAMSSPVQTAILQAAFLLITAVGVHQIGRWRGGAGDFSGALLLIGWLQFILLCLQLIQLAALVLFPPLAEVIGILGLLLSLWMLTHFIVELHGFQSAVRVFFAVIAAVFLAAMTVSLLIVSIAGLGA